MLVGAPLVTIGVIVGAMLWNTPRTPALRERDLVVLSDFRNRTGDAMFDDTMGEALGLQLRQSPYLNLLNDQQVQATLQLMGRQPMEPLTPEVAREMCQRAGAKAMLGGTIAMLGTSYVVTLNAQNCVSGEVLAEEQVQAGSKEEVITALGNAASAFRETLGESLASVQRYDANIEQATTKSLEALKAYSQAMVVRRTKGDFDALPLFRRAVELDPEFASAHGRLGTVLSNLGERPEAEKAATRAYELRDKVSERERLYIEARYFTTVSRDQLKAIDVYRQSLATYPDDYAAHSNLGSLYRDRGMLKEAVAHLEQAVKVAPNQPLSRVNLASAYIDEGRPADARREFDEVLKIQESVSARNGLFIIGVLTGDQSLADAQIAAVKGRREEVDLIAVRAQAAGYQGKMKEAATLTDDLWLRTQAANRLPQASEGFLALAIAQASVGRRDQARKGMDRVIQSKTMTEAGTDEMVAIAAILGDAKLANEYEARAMRHVQSVSAPADLERNLNAVRTLAALANRRDEEAYKLASAAATEPSGNQRNSMFVAGIAAFRLKQWDNAIKAFESLSGYGPKNGLSTVAAASHIWLGRSLAAAGRTQEARQAYDKAFAIWKDADADLPLLVEARNEYASLK